MTSPDQVQELAHYMEAGIGGMIVLGLGGAALYKTAGWGFNKYDSLMELREIRKYQKGNPKTATNEQLLDSGLPIRPVLAFIERRDQKESRIRQAMDRRAKLGQRGGQLLFDASEIPSTPVSDTKEVPFDEIVRIVEESWGNMMDDLERYPDTNGFSPEDLECLTEMFGGPRRAAYHMRNVVDPEIMIQRAELTA